LLANLEKRSTHGKFNCFLEVGDDKLEILEDVDFIDRAARD